MTREIHLVGKLGRGQMFTVDDTDYLPCRKHYWWLYHDYVATQINGKVVPVQNFIMGIESNSLHMIDHIDLNKRNNTRCNLREATAQQNNCNRPVRSINKLGYKGVTQRGDKYEARIYLNYKEIYLGRFDTAIEAACAYDRASILYHGQFGRTNFPKEYYE